jgi:dsRNA-specific ribonuclease
MRSNPASLVKIEETLDAVARTPTKHRDELRLQVNLPVLSQVLYQSLPADALLTGYTKTIESLAQVYGSLKITEDPYVLDLMKDNTEKSIRQLQKVRMNHKTWCQDQMKSLYATSLRVCREMGAYGADWYIAGVISKFTKMADENDNYLGIWDVSSAEKLYLAKALRNVKISQASSDAPAAMLVSDKITKMIDAILEEHSTFQGIIFVQTRAEVAVLFHVLSIHPRTRGRFRMGTMVGTSNHIYRAKTVGELIDINAQKHTLSLFKTGVINLVIATSVLEEGIDVPACNIVVCFQKPANLKSFVQRRGRARHQESRLILLLDPSVDGGNDWQQLETDMKKLYEDEMRELNEVLILEDAEEHDGRELRVESTRALLDLDNAMAHLYHFCATLPAKEYVDLRPEFICSDAGSCLVRCQIILPLSVNENLRKHESRSSWVSEKNAMKDAAFEAYASLYRAGLVNDNLLPLLRHDAVVDELLRSEVEKRASIISVDEQLNPWVDVAKTWGGSGDIQKGIVTLGDLNFGVYLPVAMPLVAPFQVYWDSKTQTLVTICPETTRPNETLAKIAEHTWTILESSFGNRFRVERKQLAIQFSTKEERPLRDQMGQQPVSGAAQLTERSGTIRDKTDKNVPYQYVEWLANKPPIETVQRPYQDYEAAPADIPHLSLIRLPRRSDFLHKIPRGNENTSTKKHSVVLPISRCTIDGIPFKIVQFGKLIPSIIRRFEITLVADQLSKVILKEVGINDLNLVVTAISASSAQESSNYQRLEFLGDSILKTCTSVQLIAEYPFWHEGYLSAKKDRLVSNSRLSRAAIETGLDKFIVTKAFTGHKWRPPYVDDLLAAPASISKRTLSTKVLADVVEALIGAAMVDGGIHKALNCLQVFLPELDWQPLHARRDLLFQRAPEGELPPTLQLLERLIGYSFKKKALLIESMTHTSSATGSQSLERLEFLGDSILDNIIVTAMYGQEPELSHFKMHLLRTALVNADFLAFMGMEWTVKQEKSDLVETKTTGEDSQESVEVS